MAHHMRGEPCLKQGLGDNSGGNAFPDKLFAGIVKAKVCRTEELNTGQIHVGDIVQVHNDLFRLFRHIGHEIFQFSGMFDGEGTTHFHSNGVTIYFRF